MLFSKFAKNALLSSIAAAAFVNPLAQSAQASEVAPTAASQAQDLQSCLTDAVKANMPEGAELKIDTLSSSTIISGMQRSETMPTHLVGLEVTLDAKNDYVGIQFQDAGKPINDGGKSATFAAIEASSEDISKPGSFWNGADQGNTDVTKAQQDRADNAVKNVLAQARNCMAKPPKM